MILDKLADSTRKRVEACKEKISLEQLKRQAAEKENKQAFLFEKMLKTKDISFICEVKKASPSKGIIAEDFPYLQIAKDYEKAGATAISVLTEPEYFLGSDVYLQEIAQAVDIPVLRKDFTVDEYQIYEAYLLGASAVLLICALLSVEQLLRFRTIADELGISCLVEAHDKDEIEKALAAKARIIGVNNRDLRDFTVNINNSIKMREYVPDEIIFVSESGIKTAQDIEALRQHNVQAALIGETFMRSTDKVTALAELFGKIKVPKIKFCGIKSQADVAIINKVEPDYIGFILAPSKRRITVKLARQLKDKLKPQIKTVGVFVDEPLENVITDIKTIQLDVVQLHGNETEEYIEKLRQNTAVDIWKAVRVKNIREIEKWQNSSADKLLFDTYRPAVAGGTGEVFDWSVLENCQRPFVLAGGLSSKNIVKALRRLSPWAVDINSTVETDGNKDSEKINEIMAIMERLK